MTLYCSICGNKVDETYLAEIEGVKLEVCELCAKFGKDVKKLIVRPRKSAEKAPYQAPEVVYEIVHDYAEKVRKARINTGLNPKDFASRISEKESIIKKVENGNMQPSIKLAEKLERTFGLKLIEVHEAKPEAKLSKGYKDEPTTFGDVVKLK
jgi:putative transcription factor